TWTETNKKPYALKLEEKAKILGMHKQKRWCLLANYKDRTLLRNDVSYWISRQTDMPYTVSGRFVELVWNGKNMGNYYLCEQIRIDNNRVDIAEPNLQDPANGGILIVIDDFLGYSSDDRYDKSPMVGFRSTGSNNRYKLPYVLKDPDEDENGNLLTSSSPTFTYLKNYVKNMEDAIYALKNNSDNSTVRQYLDYDRAIDYVLIQELTMNHDSYNTWPNAGPHSAYLYKDAGGKLCYGPVWDFDYHTFTLYNDAAYSNPSSSENNRLRQWELLKMDAKGNNKYYFADLAKYDPEFRTLLVERWNRYKNTWKNEFPKYVDMMADSIRLSESYNNSLWKENESLTNYRQNGDYNLTFQQAVNALKTAFQKRWTWIDENITKLGR
ncbi:MAG: CotH kinase family protein, partial [Bacteroidaceae bacterium]|nr:CotH kinase family protein [Bacteroidaceae bacterium]